MICVKIIFCLILVKMSLSDLRYTVQCFNLLKLKIEKGKNVWMIVMNPPIHFKMLKPKILLGSF